MGGHMRRANTILVLLMLLHSAPATPQQAPATGTIEGIVVRADSGEPRCAPGMVSAWKGSGITSYRDKGVLTIMNQ